MDGHEFWSGSANCIDLKEPCLTTKGVLNDHNYIGAPALFTSLNSFRWNKSTDYFAVLPEEMILLILTKCDLAEIMLLSATCRRLNNLSINFEKKWKALCFEDFDVKLTAKGKFSSFYTIYRLIYCSRILLGSFIYCRYFTKLQIKTLPPWLMVWASLSDHPPLMKFGRHRIKRRINGHYFKKLNDIPYGQVRKIYDLTAYADLFNLFPTRQERGTIYFSWAAIRYAACKKYGGENGFQAYLLDKCYRARGFIERNYKKVLKKDPLIPL